MLTVDMHGHIVHTWAHVWCTSTGCRPIYNVGHKQTHCFDSANRRLSVITDDQTVIHRVPAVRGRLPLGNRRAITPAVFYYYSMQINHVNCGKLSAAILGLTMSGLLKLPNLIGSHSAPACQFQDSRQICGWANCFVGFRGSQIPTNAVP